MKKIIRNGKVNLVAEEHSQIEDVQINNNGDVFVFVDTSDGFVEDLTISFDELEQMYHEAMAQKENSNEQ